MATLLSERSEFTADRTKLVAKQDFERAQRELEAAQQEIVEADGAHASTTKAQEKELAKLRQANVALETERAQSIGLADYERSCSTVETLQQELEQRTATHELEMAELSQENDELTAELATMNSMRHGAHPLTH